MLRSPLRYPGGKAKVADYLVSLFPSNGFTEYREPFIGGGSVMMAAQAVYGRSLSYGGSDLHTGVSDFWRAMTICPTDTVRVVQTLKDRYSKGKDLYEHLLIFGDASLYLTIAERGARFFLLNRITYSGLAESGGYSESAFQGRLTDSSVARLSRMSFKFLDFDVVNDSYETLLTSGNGSTFTFLDPPYEKAEASKLYGVKGSTHTGFDHDRFCQRLGGVKDLWLMTIDDTPRQRERYADYFTMPLQVPYSMGRSKVTQELLVSNFEFGP